MRHSVHAFLRDCLKVTNWALLLMGLGFALTSGYFLLQFTRASHDALADASAPPQSPPPSVPGLPATNTSRIDRVLNTQPWFLWAFVVLGAYLFIAAAIGIAGADFASTKCGRCGVSTHAYLVFFALVVQVVFVTVLFVDPAGAFYSAPDVTGAEAKVFGVVRNHVQVARGFLIAALVLQLVDVLLAFLLARTPHAPAETESEDDDAYFEKHYGRRRRTRRRRLKMDTTAENDSTEGSLRGGNTTGGSRLRAPLLNDADRDHDGDDSSVIHDSDSLDTETETWAERMRSRYNLDTSRLTYDPERASAGGRGVGDGDDGGEKKSCSVM